MILDILAFSRIVFGLFFLLFVPGYALMLVLFPRKEDLSFAERIGFACALSVVADLLTTLFIDLVLHIPTTAVNIILALFLVTIFAGLIWGVEILLILIKEKEEERKKREREDDDEKN